MMIYIYTIKHLKFWYESGTSCAGGCISGICTADKHVSCVRATQIKTYSWDNAQVTLAGNKCDMEEERIVSVDSGRLLAEQLGE